MQNAKDGDARLGRLVVNHIVAAGVALQSRPQVVASLAEERLVTQHHNDLFDSHHNSLCRTSVILGDVPLNSLHVVDSLRKKVWSSHQLSLSHALPGNTFSASNAVK